MKNITRNTATIVNAYMTKRVKPLAQTRARNAAQIEPGRFRKGGYQAAEEVKQNDIARESTSEKREARRGV